MLDLATKPGETAVAALAWRIWFLQEGEQRPEGYETIEIREPANVTALLQPIEATEAVAPAEQSTGEELTVVWLPPGVTTPVAIERDAERWFRSSRVGRQLAIARADIRTVRVACDGDRALIYASPEDLNAALDAVVRFVVAERETAAIEEAMGQSWADMEADASLTHAVRWRDRKRQNHVNEMTVLAAKKKLAWIRATNALEQLDPRLTEASKRLFAELVSAASLYDRLEMLENPIQFAVDQYELANTRLIERGMSSKERMNAILGFLLEAMIIALLALQILQFKQ